MTHAAPHTEAVAAAAFARYAEASKRFQQTHQPADALAARREFDRFSRVYLTPDELAGLKAADIPALRRSA